MPLFGETFDSQSNQRTYREPELPDRPTVKSAVEQAVDYHYAIYKAECAKREAEERRLRDEQRQRQEAERRGREESDRAARLAQFRLQEELEQDQLDRLGIVRPAQMWSLK